MSLGHSHDASPLPSGRWLPRFRAGFYVAAAAAVLAWSAISGASMPVALLVGLFGGAAFVSWPAGRLIRSPEWAPWVVTLLLIVDVLVLSAALALTGGSANPFTLLFFIQVTLAAVTLPPWGTAAVVGTACLGYGSLFLIGEPHLHDSRTSPDQRAYQSHLQGMWLAFTITAAVIGFFVARLTQALRREREIRARTARLLSLTTLAAGAAHELGNPLGTIQLVASDLERELRASRLETSWAEDASVIVAEVRRARGVLDRMAAGAGELRGEGPRRVPARGLVEALQDWLGEQWTRVDADFRAEDAHLRIPVHSTTQALAQLVRNGFEASASAGRVGLRVEAEDQSVRFVVSDQGIGMSPEVWERAGEPFFTTKAPGQGMGLGLFLTRTLVEQLGGRMVVRSRRARGTEVTVELPRSAA